MSLVNEKTRLMVLVMLLSATIAGCGAVTRNHSVVVSPDGGGLDPINKAALSQCRLDSTIASIFKAVNDSNKEHIAVFIHGGLNTVNASDLRVKRLKDIMLRDNVYPIFINWNTGLISSYAEHIFQARQGIKWDFFGFLSSPFVLVSDVTRAVGRLPITTWYKFVDTFNALPFLTREPGGRDVGNMLIAEFPITDINSWRKNGKPNVPTVGDYSLAETPTLIDSRGDGKKLRQALSDLGQLSAGAVTATAFDLVGTGSWSSMKRRVDAMFRKSISAYELSQMSDGNLSEIRAGAVSRFLDLLEKYQDPNTELNYELNCQHPSDINKTLQPVESNSPKQLLLVAHSAGALVANRVLDYAPDLHWEKIIHLASAAPISEYALSILPYMKKHNCIGVDNSDCTYDGTKFYNLMLHPLAEYRDNYGLGLGGTGSLLVQIDNVYNNPTSEIDRVQGKWPNVASNIDLFLNETSHQTYLRTMPLADGYPVRHGDFASVKFCHAGQGRFWRGELNEALTIENIGEHAAIDNRCSTDPELLSENDLVACEMRCLHGASSP